MEHFVQIDAMEIKISSINILGIHINGRAKPN